MLEEVKLNIEKALKLRVDNNLTYLEIAEIMNRPMGTIKRWLSPYKIKIKLTDSSLERRRNGYINRSKPLLSKRINAYTKACENREAILQDKYLRDFINMYIGEGSKSYKDDRISIVNSDPDVIYLSLAIMQKYFRSEGKLINFKIKYYEHNNNKDSLLKYWKQLLSNYENIIFSTYALPNQNIKEGKHNNSNKFGLIVVAIYDTYAKIKLNAYIDYLKEEWKQEFENTFGNKIDRNLLEIK